MRAVLWILAGFVGIIVAFALFMGEFADDDPGFSEKAGRFEGRFLALSDADMAATAYANGGLEPFDGARDMLTLFSDGIATSTIEASNSVISWPQVVDVSPDGRFAAVIETRGPAAADIETYNNVYTDFPQGSRLGLYAIDGDNLSLVEGRDGVGRNPQSVEYSPDGRFLVIGSEEAGAELVVVTLTDAGRLRDVRTFPLAPPYRDDDAEKRIRSVHLAPDGLTLAVNTANRRVQFYRLTVDATGLPTGVVAFGSPSPDLGKRLSIGKWTPNGKHFLITDTNWADGTLYMLTQGPGALTVLAPPETINSAPAVMTRTEVGRSPEGFGISADGTRVAAINMERTYLPEMPPLAIWQGRRRYSVSLLALDPETGTLAPLDQIFAAGILPEDVIFDETGRHLAVAVFHRRKGADRKRGFVDFFSIDDAGKLEAQGITQPVMRGAHDLVRIP